MNGIVVGLLPGVLWMVAVIFAVSIITITVSRGHLFTPKRRRPPVDPVDHAQLPGAIIIFVLVLLELVAMYLQARNASESEMDKRLGVASHRNKDDVAK